MILSHVIEVLFLLAFQDAWVTVTMFECPPQRFVFICPNTFKLCERSFMVDQKGKVVRLHWQAFICLSNGEEDAQAKPGSTSSTAASWHLSFFLTIPFFLFLCLPLCLCPFLFAFYPFSLEKSVGLHLLKASYLGDVTSQFALAKLFGGGMCIDFSVCSGSGANSWMEALKPNFKCWELVWHIPSFMYRHMLKSFLEQLQMKNTRWIIIFYLYSTLHVETQPTVW